jgi:hypothetical protein
MTRSTRAAARAAQSEPVMQQDDQPETQGAVEDTGSPELQVAVQEKPVKKKRGRKPKAKKAATENLDAAVAPPFQDDDQDENIDLPAILPEPNRNHPPPLFPSLFLHIIINDTGVLCRPLIALPFSVSFRASFTDRPCPFLPQIRIQSWSNQLHQQSRPSHRLP